MKTCNRLLILLVLTLLSACSETDQYQLTEETLPNGLTTTIIQNKNSHSSNEVDLRLLIKAGSLQENDDELGYAHFVEHMAFNGTRDYPKNKLVDALNNLGIRFGSHANASTGFDLTEYRIKLDTNEPERLAKAISILKQWAALIEFKTEDVRSEIPIIIQEWQLREPTLERASFKLREATFKGSRFAKRFPIGTLESIQNATPEKLRAFFKRWYTPSNTQLIISGDIQTQQIQQLIAKHFSDWGKTPDADSPVVSNLNLKAVPEQVSFTDSVMLGSEISLAFAVPSRWPQTLQQREDALLWQIGLDILRQRLVRRLISSRGKVTQSFTQWSRPSPNILHIGLTAVLSKDDYQHGIDLLSSELAHINSNGITQQELDAAVNSILTHESAQQDSSSHLSSTAVNNALYGWPIIDQPTWYNALKTSLPKLTPQHINTALNTVLRSKPHIIVNRSTQLPAPDMALLKKSLAEPKTVKPVQTTLTGNDIWAIDPATQGTITTESKQSTGADKWELSNGISVFYKYSDSAPGKVYFELAARGGLNLFDAPEVFHARLALPVMRLSGLRGMNAEALGQWINSKGMQLNPNMDFSRRGFNGYSPSKNFQSLMQLLYVALTEAKVSNDASEHVIQQSKIFIEQLRKQDHYQGLSRIDRELLMSDPALRSMTPAELQSINQGQMQAIYKHYFSNAQQYQLAIVGDISSADAKAVVLATLANLPKNHPKTKPRSFPTPKQSVSFEYVGNGRRNAGVSLKWFLPRSATDTQTYDGFQVLARLLQEALISKIREELGLVYTINVSSQGNSYDSKTWSLSIDLACDVEQREEVVRVINETLASLPKDALSQNKIDGAIKAMKDERHQSFNAPKTQATWLAVNSYFNEENEPHTLELNKRFQKISAASLDDLLKLFLSDQNTTAVIGSLP